MTKHITYRIFKQSPILGLYCNCVIPREKNEELRWVLVFERVILTLDQIL